MKSLEESLDRRQMGGGDRSKELRRKGEVRRGQDKHKKNWLTETELGCTLYSSFTPCLHNSAVEHLVQRLILPHLFVQTLLILLFYVLCTPVATLSSTTNLLVTYVMVIRNIIATQSWKCDIYPYTAWKS